jgi:hypothetical protein
VEYICSSRCLQLVYVFIISASANLCKVHLIFAVVGLFAFLCFSFHTSSLCEG